MDFERWIKSEQGQRCNGPIIDSKGNTQPWLRNRLWYAFDAGTNSKDAMIKMNNHINDLQKKIRTIKRENGKLKKLYAKFL